MFYHEELAQNPVEVQPESLGIQVLLNIWSPIYYEDPKFT